MLHTSAVSGHEYCILGSVAQNLRTKKKICLKYLKVQKDRKHLLMRISKLVSKSIKEYRYSEVPKHFKI